MVDFGLKGMDEPSSSQTDWSVVARGLRDQAKRLGFSDVGVAPLDVEQAARRLQAWLDRGLQGEMQWLQESLPLRANPQQIVPGALRAIMVRMPYLQQAPERARQHWQDTLNDGRRANVSRYAWGRDYHKVLRRRLQQLADWLQEHAGPMGYRVFVDSGPVFEVELARQAGLGWRGKHTLLLDRNGSWFFLGTLLTDLPLPIDEPTRAHCGSCRRCLDVCPTQAFTGPYELDARRCISYLTIESREPIPLELRPLMGNRIYGCDDCQAVCPWNRWAEVTAEADFQARHRLDVVGLLELFAWDEESFLRKTEGSAIRRIGYARWRRNLAIALGNAPADSEILAALRRALQTESDPALAEQMAWAVQRQQEGLA